MDARTWRPRGGAAAGDPAVAGVPEAGSCKPGAGGLAKPAGPGEERDPREQRRRVQSESLGLGPSDALSVGLAISAPSAPAEPCLAGGGTPSPLGGGAG